MHLVVGLGNPGARYAKTRHNVGFLAVERAASRARAAVDKKLYGALVGDGILAGTKVMFAMPQQFMNLSGQPVASILGFYKIPASDLIVVHDDMDLPFGRLRVRVGGGHGGHNGIRDIHRLVGTEFVRVRVGVGRPPEKMDPADWVLAPWSAAESAALDPLLDSAVDAVESVVRVGVTQTMNTFNAAPTA
ncbi:MAG: aminoacyl-tRNA hydrolase [Pseudomonadota bacterium]|nr:aminoacyl-tRNA hydrolase [Pseudomonadota bacterium]